MKRRFEYISVFFLSFLTVLFIELQFIVDAVRTPKNTFYLGTVHWPPDYFYYLSQFIQGKSHVLSSTILYTGERLPLTVIGWQNVLAGRILTGILGLQVILTYQITVVLFLSFFLILAYRLLLEIFPKEAGKRMLSFFFFVTSTSMPLFSGSLKTGLKLSFYNYWYNTGNIFDRLGPAPNHLLASAFMAAGFLLSALLVKSNNSGGKRKKILAGLSVCGLLLASISPVEWGLLVAAVFGAAFIYQRKRFQPYYFAPFIALFLSGLPLAVYVKYIFYQEPYVKSSLWEATQQLAMTPYALFMGSGLVIIFALIGGWAFFRKTTFERLAGLFLIAISAFFYFSPTPDKLGLTNARFWPPAIYIFIAAGAAQGVFQIYQRFSKHQKIILIFLIIIYLFTIIPSDLAQQREEVLVSRAGNAFYYIPSDAYGAYIKTMEMTVPNDIILAQWPFNESFPALTGRKSFFGYNLYTINSAQKEKDIFAFFDGKMSPEEVKNMLAGYKIDYILGYPWIAKIDSYPFLKKVFQNNILALYKVLAN
ncbi:hypothetical protein M1271_07065 [Patescibacteria group bacterium]|nr:hypothetical protein [Patescibacteria group bacterium]